MPNMYSDSHYRDIARVINAQYQTATNGSARHAITKMAVALGGSFASDSEAFNAEKFFTWCYEGFGYDDLIQRSTNALGQLTVTDVDAAKAAIDRPGYASHDDM